MSVAQNLISRTVLDGKYALLREIGAGASGKVYEAEHLVVGKFVAIKVMHRASFADPEQRDQFVSEARAAARIPHVKVLDFGIARRMLEADGSAAKGSGGTPLFMSPEQARGEAVDARSDLYSASAMLYAMLSGHEPFEGNTTFAVLQKVTAGDFAPLCKVNPQVPKLLATIVERGMALEPRRRIDSAEEYAELLHPFIGTVSHAISLGPRRQLGSDPLPLVANQPVKIEASLTPEG